jgi:hypothetical protein
LPFILLADAVVNPDGSKMAETASDRTMASDFMAGLLFTALSPSVS